MFVRLIAAAAAVLSLTAFTDPANHFTIEFPEGWTAPADDGQGNIQSAPPKGTQGACRANNVNMPGLTGTQEEINAKYGAAPMDAATWASVLSFDPTKIEVSDGSAAVVDGHTVQIATVTMDKSLMGVPAKARFATHIMTGRMVNAGCFAPSNTYDKLKDVFDTVVKSLKPL